MAAIILPRRFHEQPQGPVEVDWSNPLARNLILALHRGRNIASGAGMAGVVPDIATSYGIGKSFTAAAGISDPWAGSLTNGLSGHVIAYPTDNTTTSSMLGIGTGVAGQYAVCDISGTEGGDPVRVLQNSAAYGGTYYANAATFNAWNVFTMVWAPGGGVSNSLYKDGILLAPSSTPGTNAALPTPIQVEIGQLTQASSSNFFVGNIAAGFLWNRQISAAEARELASNPWQIFRPQVRRLYFNTAGGFTDAALSAAGSAAVALASQAIAKAALSSAGVASVSPVAQAVSQSALSASGVSTASAVGQALYNATVTAAGLASASFGAQSVSVSALASSGTATSAWSGQSLATSAMSSDGTSTSGWTAKSLTSSTVTAAGIASASFVALTSGFVDAVMSASGVGAFSVTAKAIATAAMSAAGSGAASWVSLVTGYADASFVMAGAAAISLAAQAIAQATTSSAATSTAAFGGQTLKQGALSASGSSTSAWSAQSLAGAVLGSVGAATAAFVGRSIVQASAFASGVGSVNWVHGNGPVVPALLRITGIRLMTAVSAKHELMTAVSAKPRIH